VVGAEQKTERIDEEQPLAGHEEASFYQDATVDPTRREVVCSDSDRG
jgi:hypothetical protein